MRGEGAVLAEALARARQRERDVSREGDAAPHPLDPTGAAAPAPGGGCNAAPPDGPPPAPRRSRDRRRARRGGLLARHRGPPGRGGQARSGLPAQRGARRHLPGPAARLRRRRGRHPRASRRRRPRPTASSSCSAGRAQFAILDIHDLALAREKGRDIVGGHGRRAAPAGRRHRPAADHAAARARGQARRGHRPALRRRRPGLDRARRRRRPGQGAQGDHRLSGGHRAARAPGRRGHGVLERRGRGAGRPSARACTSSRSTTSAPRPTPSSCCA